MTVRGTASRVVEGFRAHGLLIEAGAIAFRTFLAVLTGALCLIGLLGFFDLSEVWRQHLAPDLRASVSRPAYELIDGAVVNVLQDQQVFWVTVGAALAVWQSSSVVRATGQVLNRIYGVDDDRSPGRELLASMAAGASAGVLLVAALGTVRLGPLRSSRLSATGSPEYLFLSAVVLLGGLLLDALAEDRAVLEDD